jgi:hypothetical protein
MSKVNRNSTAGNIRTSTAAGKPTDSRLGHPSGGTSNFGAAAIFPGVGQGKLEGGKKKGEKVSPTPRPQ